MNSLRVLVVDDHPLQLKRMQSQLFALNVRSIDCLTSGADALKHLESHSCDLLFCDLNMPGMDGVELLSQLAQIDYSGHIVLMSALEESIISSVRWMCLALGLKVVGAIDKPCSDKEVRQLVQSCTYHCVEPERKAESIVINDEEFLFALASGQVINHYQPKFNFSSRLLVGVEALARWVHPKHGVIYPNVFLPIVERCGLQNELFSTVFSNVIKDIKADKLPCSTAINVTHNELEQANFSHQFLEKCQHHSVSPSMITLELTETEVYRDSTNLYRNLARLRLNSVGLAIDDFGTGYSSLSKLSQLPFTEIKIDRSFIQMFRTNAKHSHIVACICELAKRMGMSLVAEGVEDETTWFSLKSLGVDVCQGYFTGRPMDIDALHRTFL
ncbi:EAL domain-containing response regulator [Vibrio agarivorans]|uniref:EAL domain-containing response regulator n=1 Tax=Vibrio agarivorans TaxID=153622 RepID=UPI002231F17E|nr:EAL domain-containing protein [Vibrio agarivorans]MDN3661463.1 EAL domain-containing protein [Vibrio agarivorans]